MAVKLKDEIEGFYDNKKKFNADNPGLLWKEFIHTEEAFLNIKSKIHFLINTQNGADIDDSGIDSQSFVSFVNKMENKLLNKDVLIVGTGIGREMLAVKSFGAISVSGITMGVRNKKFAEEVVGEFPIICDAHSCPWDDSSFDVIVGFQVLEHMYSQIMFLFECNRLLRIGGEIHLETPPSRSVSTDSWLHHILCPTPRQMICLYLKAGFKPIECHCNNYEDKELVVKDVYSIDTTSAEDWLDITTSDVYLYGVKENPFTYQRGDINRFYNVIRTGNFNL